jgi:tetratricopeptide (TPR) repeat protein
MEGSRWNSAEEYRAVQGLVREGRYREAVERARQAVQDGDFGRRHSAKLHSQICWIYNEYLPADPEAVLHGEQATRLAELYGEPFVKSEALSRLVVAYCRLGDIDRARAACEQIARVMEEQPLALSAGRADLLMLEALVCEAAGDLEGRIAVLQEAEEAAAAFSVAVVERVQLQLARALIDVGRWAEARKALGVEDNPSIIEPLEWKITRVWLELGEGGPEAAASRAARCLELARRLGQPVVLAEVMALQALVLADAQAGEAERLARQALERAIATGRPDLIRRLRQHLTPLLKP